MKICENLLETRSNVSGGDHEERRDELQHISVLAHLGNRTVETNCEADMDVTSVADVLAPTEERLRVLRDFIGLPLLALLGLFLFGSVLMFKLKMLCDERSESHED